MKRKIYRSSATILLGSVFLFGLAGCSSTLNFSAWFPFWGQEEGYFAAKKTRQDIQAIYRLACAYQERNQHQAALEEFKRVLRLDPAHAQSYNGMGISYDRLGNHSRALGCYTAALKINADLDYVHNNMGYSYLLQGEPARAVESFRKAVALNGKNDRYRNNLGVAYAQVGKVHLALAAFESTEKEALTPAVQENQEIRQVAEHPAEEQTPAMARVLADDLSADSAMAPPAAIPGPALFPVVAAPQVAAPARAAAVEPAPQVAATVRPASQATQKAPPAPARTVASGPVTQAGEQATPLATVSTLAIDQPPAARVQARPQEKAVAEKKPASEPPALAAAVAHAPIARPGAGFAPPAQTAPARQLFPAHLDLTGVEVVNGTGGKGVASWWGNHLRQQGVPVARFTTASSNYAKTKVYYSEGYLQEAYQIAQIIPLYQEFEKVAVFADSKVTVRVVIGRDVLRFTGKENKKNILLARAGF